MSQVRSFLAILLAFALSILAPPARGQAPLNDLSNWYVVGSGYSSVGTATPGTVTTVSGATAATFSARTYLHGTGSYIRLVYGAYTSSGNIGEVSLPNAISIKAGFQPNATGATIKIATGWTVFQQVGGKVVQTRQDGPTATLTYGLAISDPIWCPYKWGSWGYAVTCVSVANSSLVIPGGWRGMSDPLRENRGLGEGCTAGDLLSLGQSAVGNKASAGDRMYGPLAVLGYYPAGTFPPQSVLIQGDSIPSGNNDGNQLGGSGMGGYIQRVWTGQFDGGYSTSVGSRVPFVPLAKGGESSQQWLDNSAIVRGKMRDFVTDVWLSASNHDAENGTNTNGWKAVLQSLTGWAAKGKHVSRIYMAPAWPKATSSDGFATAANQTPTGGTPRSTVNSWLRDPSSSGFVRQSAACIRSGQTLRVVDINAAIEVDATNAIATNGGRFLVGNTTPDFTGTVDSTQGLTTFAARCTFDQALPAVGELQSCVGVFTSGAAAGVPFNVQYDTSRGATVRQINWLPAFTVAPSVGDRFALYKVAAANGWHGPPTDTGIHGLKNTHARVASYIASLPGIIRDRSLVIPDTAIAPPPVAFDPYGLTSWFLFDPRNQGRLFTDTGATTPVTSDGNTVKAWVGDNSGTTHTLTDTVGGTYGASGSSGQPYVLLNGSKLRYPGATGTSSITQPCWFMVVYRQVSVVASGVIFSGNNGTTHRILVNNPASGSTLQLSAGTSASLGSNANTTLHRLLIVCNGASSYAYVDGVKTSTLSIGTQDLDGLTLGAGHNTMTTSASNTEYYFVGTFAGTPTISQETGAVQYMAANW